MKTHADLVRRWRKRFHAVDAAHAADPMAMTALAQPCAVEIEGACKRYDVTLLAEPDSRYAMAIPVCSGCRAYLEKLWGLDMYSDEAAIRFDGAVARTWERGALIGAVNVTGKVSGARPVNWQQPLPKEKRR